MTCQKRALEDSDGGADTDPDALSKNKLKLKARNPYKKFGLEHRREFGATLMS